MEQFISIFITIILPIFVIMAIGFYLQIKYKLDVQTLARLNIYYLVPGFIFVKLYDTELSANLFGQVLFFVVMYVLILAILAVIVGRGKGLDKKEQTTFTNSIVFFNSGNYGVPVNDLVFKSDPFAMSIQVIVLTFQNILTFSYGIFSMQSLQIGKMRAALAYFKMPVMYAMLAGASLNYFSVPIPSVVWVPANYIADAMVGMALLTLGAQVAQIRFVAGLGSVYWSLLLRLIIGPIIAFGLIVLFKIDGVMAQALLIASAMPTSVNSAVIAQEYKSHPELAATIVLFSTGLSAVTVSIVIFLSKILF